MPRAYPPLLQLDLAHRGNLGRTGGRVRLEPSKRLGRESWRELAHRRSAPPTSA